MVVKFIIYVLLLIQMHYIAFGEVWIVLGAEYVKLFTKAIQLTFKSSKFCQNVVLTLEDIKYKMKSQNETFPLHIETKWSEKTFKALTWSDLDDCHRELTADNKWLHPFRSVWVHCVVSITLQHMLTLKALAHHKVVQIGTGWEHLYEIKVSIEIETQSV